MTREVEPIWKTGPKPKAARKPMRRRALKTGSRPVAAWSTDADYEIAQEIVHRRSRGVCEHCGAERATNVHHKAGRGGSQPHEPDRLLDVCGDCHAYIHAHPAESYANGTMIRRNGQVSA